MSWSALSRAQRTGLGLATVVLFATGAPLILAAVLHVVLDATLAGIGLGVIFAAVGAFMIVAAVGLFTGRRLWWLVAIAMVPVTAAAQFLDAYVYGGRTSVTWGIVMPIAALAGLLLPGVRSLFTRPGQRATADSST